MSDDCIAGEEKTKKDEDCVDEEVPTTLQVDDKSDSKVHPSGEYVSDINSLGDNLKDDKHVVQKREDNPPTDIADDIKEVTKVQDVASQKNQLSNSSQSFSFQSLPGPSKQPTSSLDGDGKPTDNIPSNTTQVIHEKPTENVTETYDVITRKEVQGLAD